MYPFDAGACEEAAHNAMQPLFGEQLRKTFVLLSEMCPEWTLAEQQHCDVNHSTHNE